MQSALFRCSFLFILRRFPFAQPLAVSGPRRTERALPVWITLIFINLTYSRAHARAQGPLVSYYGGRSEVACAEPLPQQLRQHLRAIYHTLKTVATNLTLIFSSKMPSELETLRKQLQEAERLREEAQRREQEAERLREEERHLYERRTGKTTLPEFLDACHTHLFLGLTIQPDSTQSTQGDAANAENKPRPDRILPWLEFDAEQASTWEDLMESSFVRERHFTSLHTLEESGEAVRRR